MKKDILAAITFIATGLLFYVIQTGQPSDEFFSSGATCDGAETVWVEKAPPDAEPTVILEDGVTRDS